ncbi:MAG: nitrous oxide reductase accessory protein NosL [Alphaproteobacteria bacterium]
MINNFYKLAHLGGAAPWRPGAVVAIAAMLVLAGCKADKAAAPPAPVSLTAQAAGHYCQMTVLDHPGPKAQVHLAGSKHPLWFAQVRDAIAFARKPNQGTEVTAVYVSDMGKAPSWHTPGSDNWIAMRAALYVTGSSRRGGMGGPELVPFALPDKAQSFVNAYGGRAISYANITDEMVLAPTDITPGIEGVSPKPPQKPH